MLPGDRWRRSHGAVKELIYVVGRILGINTQKEVCGLFTYHHSDGIHAAYGGLRTRERRKQKTVPDLTTTNHLEGPVLEATRLQLFELKRGRSGASAAPRECQLDQMTSTAYADGALLSELRAVKSPRYLAETRPKQGQQL